MKILSELTTRETCAPAATRRSLCSSASTSRRPGCRPSALLSVFVTILATVGLSSCVGLTSGGKTGTPGSSTGLLSASGTSLSFGNVAVGSTKTQGVTVTNSGTAAVNISNTTLSSSDYTVMGTPPGSIAVGASVTLQIQLAPSTKGTDNGSLAIVSDASNSPLKISLAGTGTDAGLEVSPASLNFGNVKVGQMTTQTVKLTNGGNIDLVVNSAQVSGNGFGMTGLSLPATIAAGKSMSFTAQFTPGAAQGMTGSIKFVDNAENSPQVLDLAGSGVSGNATLTVNPGSIAFGSEALGSTLSQTITLTNSGATSIAISKVTPSGTGFSMTNPSAMTLNAGQSTAFSARFTPTSIGSATGSIEIDSNATNPTVTVALSGTGTQGQLAANPSSASFGNVATGSSNSQTIHLTNGGSSSVSISQANVTGTGFSVSGLPSLPMTINSGGSTTFNAVFSPTNSGSVTGSISLVSNAPNSPLTISLSGTGQAATRQLSASSGSLSFNSVNDGSSSTLNVTLTNTGNASVTISSVTASGPGFSESGGAGTTLTPNQATTLNISFSPTNSGAVAGNVTVASNATNSPTIALSGTGVQASTHSASLTWTASVSTDVVGYNIYRSVVSGGPYSALDTAPVSADAYQDSTVQAGQTYFYVVRSVDNEGTESANSTEVPATIP
jgi:hypothetical protein